MNGARGLLLLALAVSGSAAEVIGRDAWSFDRSLLEWYPYAKVEANRAQGVIKDAAGWTEYDFAVASPGWFELWERDGVAHWSRDLFLDGAQVLSSTESRPEDLLKVDGRVWYKEANLHLAAGKHVLRLRRLAFPGVLPSRWELRPSDGDPAGCIRVTAVANTVLRAGSRVRLVLSGGTNVATRYPLVVRDESGGTLAEGPVVEFPASAQPLERVAEITFPRQGVFQILARLGDRLSRPADLKAGSFIVIDTAPPPAPGTLSTTPVVRIDCVAQTINGRPVEPGRTFFEKDGASRVVSTAFGSYRESSGRGAHAWWATDGFSYKVDLPDADHLYRLRVTYPDDDRRSMGLWTSDGADGNNGVVHTGGVETGDRYPLTRAMQVHEAFFYPLKHQGVVVAAVNLVPGYRAAAAAISIDRIDSALPAGPTGPIGGRTMGFFFEEGPRWMRFFGANAGEGTAGQLQHLRCLDRWGQWNRYIGANLMFPTVCIYGYNMYPSRLLDGYRNESHDAARMVALTAEKYGGRFIGEFHLSGQEWFDRHIMGVWSEEAEADGKKVRHVRIDPRAEAYVLRDRDGNTDLHNQRGWGYNALHPEIQERYLAIIGEFVDRFADSPAFAGVSSRLMLDWVWQGWDALPGLDWGYDDWTMAQFAQETGLTVPGSAGDPGRFRQRFDWLTGPQRERWLDWRCERIFTYHCRIRDRIRVVRPDAKLFFNWFSREGHQGAGIDQLSQMRAIGLDLRRYAAIDGIVVIPNAFYGRRYSTPVGDAMKAEPLYATDVHTIAGFGDRGFGLYTDYYEVCKDFEWPPLGGRKGSSAFDCCAPGGVNERELYALALANADSSVLVNGGNGWMFGTPEVLSPFLREYRALPALRFEPFTKLRDPVAVWSRRVTGAEAARLGVPAGLHFYAVNRLAEPVQVSLSLTAADRVVSLVDRLEVGRAGADVAFTLEPFMLRAMCAEGETAVLADGAVATPPAIAGRVRGALPTAVRLLDGLRRRRVAPELDACTAERTARGIETSLAAAAEGRWWQALGELIRPDLVRLYDLAGRYPTGLLERQEPHGLADAADAPVVEPAGILGDVRGRLAAVADLDVDADGDVWVASADQVMLVDGKGQYRRNPVFAIGQAPFDGSAIWGKLLNPRYLGTSSLRATQDGRILALAWNTPPASYSPLDGRLLPLSAGDSLAVPGMRCSILAVDRRGDAYIACPEPATAAGLYKFRADGRPAFEPGAVAGQRLLTSVPAGGAVDAADNLYCTTSEGLSVIAADGRIGLLATAPEFRGLGRIATSPDGLLLIAVAGDGKLQAFRQDPAAGFAHAWTWSPPQRVSALSFAPGGDLVLGFAGETAGAVARRYRVAADGLQPAGDLIAGLSAIATRSLRGPTQLKTWGGKLYFLAHDKLMRLEPGSLDAAEVACDPGPVATGIESFALAPDGTLYLASNFGFHGNTRGMNVYRSVRRSDGGWSKPVMLGGKPLVDDWSYRPTDLAVDALGRLLLRLDDPDVKSDGPSVSIFRWSADGTRERLVQLGATLPWGDYGLHLDADGGLLVAGGGTRTLTRLGADGSLAWQVSGEIHQGHGSLPLRQPFGVTRDRRGRIWVTEPARNQVLCFAPDGRFLAAYGHYGNLDVRDGFGLRNPMGIAALETGEGEWLYIADVGNQRLVRWRLP